MIRRCLFWFHLVVGVAAGIVILIMSLTGVLLAYEKQIIAWADSDYLEQAAPAGQMRRPLTQLAEAARTVHGAGAPSAITVYPGRRAVKIAANAATAGAGSTAVYVDGYSGDVLGTSSPRIAAFFRSVTSWHRTLAAPQDFRAWGKAATGAANLGFVFIVASGLYIWWPGRNRKLSQVAWFRRGLTGKARNWNWHNALGFWSAVPLFLIALSATVISYPWATALVYQATGTPPPSEEGERRPNPAQGDNAARRSEQRVALASIDPMFTTLERDADGLKSISLRVPASNKAPVNFTLDRGTGGQPQLRSTVTFDPKTAEITRTESFADQNAGRRARSWMRFVHTGEYYGLIGQGIAGLASLAGVVLSWTGLSLAWNRFALCLRSKRERRASAAGVLVNEGISRRVSSGS